MFGSSTSISTSDTNEKKSLRRMEIALNKFNEVAVPYHVDLMKKHKTNIERFERLGQLSCAHREHVNAGRAIQQLKALIFDIDSLRMQLQDEDLAEFAKRTAKSRQMVQEAIQSYLDMEKPDINKLQYTNEEWPGERQEDASPKSLELPPLQVQLDLEQEEKELARKEAYLRSWQTLQNEFEDLQQLFQDFAALVETQGNLVTQAETHVETVQQNVEEGAKQLKYASQLKVASYPMFGALLGGCLGGPIGLLAGLKLGGLAAFGGGILGFTGGKFLKTKITAQNTPNTNDNSEPVPESNAVVTASSSCINAIS